MTADFAAKVLAELRGIAERGYVETSSGKFPVSEKGQRNAKRRIAHWEKVTAILTAKERANR